MNERIAKLYEQAIVLEDGGDYVAGELDPEKFAELIVKECSDIAAKNQAENMGWDIGEIIKEHFGVEE